MPKFSQKSIDRLEQADPQLQKLFNEAIKKIDFSIICSYRGKEAQNLAYRQGHSTKQYPNSKHNCIPSLAVDIYPYPLDSINNIQAFKDLAVVIKEVATKLNIPVKWGGEWKTFKDYPHWEL